MSLLGAIEARIAGRESLASHRHRWALQGLKVVFTNGCFDILHEGHLRYLAAARDLGNVLVVGVNSDASVRRLKGPERPVNSESSRLLMLAGLVVTDLVVSFDEDTPLELIRELEPDVLVKGGDWTEDRIVGSDLVRARGGEVYSLPFHEGFSTTGLIGKIRSL